MDLLEARLFELERRVGLDRGSETAVELLSEAATSMKAALTGRDRAGSTIARAAELDRFLEPGFEDRLDLASTVECLLEGDIEGRCLGLERLMALAPVLDAAALAGTTALRPRLDRLTLEGLETRSTCDEGRARAYALVDEYNALIANITRTLVRFDDAVTRLEIEAKPKKVVE